MAMKTPSNLIVVGAFEQLTQAQQAMQALRDAGFEDDQIGFVVRRNENAPGNIPADPDVEMVTDTAGGAISGGILGGIVGAAAALLIPGLGPILAGGILAATLGGIVIGAAAGGIVGALTGMGLPEEEAQYYQQAFEAGNTIVTVHVDDRSQHPQEARAILHRYGASDINARPNGDRAASPTSPTPPPPPPATTSTEPGRAYNPNVPSATYNSSTQPPPETQAPTTSEGTYNPDVPPATYSSEQQNGER